jgi:hypothetical protein
MKAKGRKKTAKYAPALERLNPTPRSTDEWQEEADLLAEPEILEDGLDGIVADEPRPRSLKALEPKEE